MLLLRSQTIYAVNNAGTAFNRFRYDPAFQRGFEAGGRLLGEGSAVLGRYGRPVPEAPYNPESELETAMDQESDLENRARKMVVGIYILRNITKASVTSFMVSEVKHRCM